MSAYNRLSLQDDFEKSSQFMILSKQTQFKLLEKKVKGKSDSVVRNLIVLRKFRQGKKYNIFEKELLNDCKYQTQEIYETIRYEGQEDKRIQESINNNNSTREHLLSKQAIIEKCLNNTPSQRIENQMKTFFAIFKKYEEFLLIIVQCKAEFQGEESNDRGELEGQENKTDDEENKILYVEKELCFMEQTDHDIDLEVERFKISVDLIKTNEKELKNVNLDIESIVMELQEKSKFSAEQENSIANINEANRELMCECEELIVKKTKLQDNSQQLEIKMEQISTLMMRVTNKAETFQLESDDKFLCIFANDEYLESKLQLESIMIDNKTLIDELESSHNSDESLITLSNVIKQQLKLKEEALVEMEKNIQSLENDLFVENEKLKQGYLKSEENDKMMARLIQQLENEAENSRIEVLFGQQTFSEHKIKWNLKYKEELDKLNELKRQESSIDIAPRNLMNDSGSSSKSRSSSQYEKVGSKNRTPTNSSKRKSNSASSALSVKQLKRQSIESGLDEPYTDDEDNDFNITFNTDTEL